jgi:hypothetical protein
MTIRSPADEDDYVLSTALSNIASTTPSSASLLAPSTTSTQSSRGEVTGGIVNSGIGLGGGMVSGIGDDTFGGNAGFAGDGKMRSVWATGQAVSSGSIHGQGGDIDVLRVDKVSLGTSGLEMMMRSGLDRGDGVAIGVGMGGGTSKMTIGGKAGPVWNMSGGGKSAFDTHLAEWLQLKGSESFPTDRFGSRNEGAGLGEYLEDKPNYKKGNVAVEDSSDDDDDDD